jgi:pentatricopeptide repeat protein
MLKDGRSPNSFSFPPLLTCCSQIYSLNMGLLCHGQAVKNGVDIILPVQNSLLHFYTSFGVMDGTRQVLNEMSAKDVVSWNTIINGLAKAGEQGLAHKLFDSMPEKDVISWNIMITGYLNSGKPGNVIKLFREMMKLGLKGNVAIMVNVLTACGRSARLKDGKSVHGFLIRNFHNSSLIIDTSLVDMYSRCGRADVARFIFNWMLVKNLVSWNVMILEYCLHGNPINGLSLYAEMTTRYSRSEDRENTFCKSKKPGDGDGIVPDEVTFVGVLCACSRVGLLTEGKNYFNQMIEVFGQKPNFAHYWCMANIFAKVGLSTEAIEFLRNIPIDIDASPETSRWAGLFSSCRFEGDVSLGGQLAKDF